MQSLTSHKVSSLNEQLDITAADDPGPSGACYFYLIESDEPLDHEGDTPRVDVHLKFQKGTIAEAGVNGITNEVLLAIVEHRLRGLQSSNLACLDSALALAHVQESMTWLHKRTRDRMARGVEGTNEI